MSFIKFGRFIKNQEKTEQSLINIELILNTNFTEYFVFLQFYCMTKYFNATSPHGQSQYSYIPQIIY